MQQVTSDSKSSETTKVTPLYSTKTKNGSNSNQAQTFSEVLDRLLSPIANDVVGTGQIQFLEESRGRSEQGGDANSPSGTISIVAQAEAVLSGAIRGGNSNGDLDSESGVDQKERLPESSQEKKAEPAAINPHCVPVLAKFQMAIPADIGSMSGPVGQEMKTEPGRVENQGPSVTGVMFNTTNTPIPADGSALSSAEPQPQYLANNTCVGKDVDLQPETEFVGLRPESYASKIQGKQDGLEAPPTATGQEKNQDLWSIARQSQDFNTIAMDTKTSINGATIFDSQTASQEDSIPAIRDAKGNSSEVKGAGIPGTDGSEILRQPTGRIETNSSDLESIGVSSSETKSAEARIGSSGAGKLNIELDQTEKKASEKESITDNKHVFGNTGNIGETPGGNNVNGAEKPVFTRAQIDKIVSSVIQQVKNTPTSLEISLKPEYLGKIQLHLQAHEGQVSIRIIAHNQETVNLLNASLTNIRENIERQGVNVQQIQVDISYQENQGNYQPNGGREERSPRSNPVPMEEKYESLENMDITFSPTHQLNILA